MAAPQRILFEIQVEDANLTAKIEQLRARIESKDLIRAQLGRSPDFADAFALRAMFDLFNTAKPVRTNRKFVVLQTPYN